MKAETKKKASEVYAYIIFAVSEAAKLNTHLSSSSILLPSAPHSPDLQAWNLPPIHLLIRCSARVFQKGILENP